jgi:hypothetical protein
MITNSLDTPTAISKGSSFRNDLITISKDYFPIDKKIDTEWTCSVYGERAIGKSPEQLEQLKSSLWQVRKDAQTWGTQKVKSVIANNARARGIACTTFKGLTSLWKKDSSSEFAAKLWFACYGDFDLTPRWEETLEEEYMADNDYYYKEEEECEEDEDKPTRKGCFARLFSHCKNDIIKGLNRSTGGPKGHNGKIRMKLTKEEATAAKMDEKLKNKKRKKGTTKGCFFTLAKDVINPAIIMKRIEADKPIDRKVSPFVGTLLVVVTFLTVFCLT